jgi:hypothetical protein
MSANSIALGGVLELAGYTAHPQNTVSLLLGLAQQKLYRIRIFTGVHVDLLLGRECTIGRGNIERQCGKISQYGIHTHIHTWII